MQFATLKDINAFTNLFNKLTKFEQTVFLAYMQNQSLEAIDQLIKQTPPLEKYKYRKSNRFALIDNALSRIKKKGRTLTDEMVM